MSRGSTRLADAISCNNLKCPFITDTRSCSQPRSDPREADEVANEGTTRLDISNLVPIVRELFSAGIAKSTQITYKSGSKWYVIFAVNLV